MTYPIKHHVTRHNYAEDWAETNDRESYLYITERGAVEGWRSKSAMPQYGEYIGGIEVHSATPSYKGQEPMPDHCQWVKGGICYTDGSSLAFNEIEHDFDSPRFIFATLKHWARGRIEFGGEQ